MIGRYNTYYKILRNFTIIKIEMYFRVRAREGIKQLYSSLASKSLAIAYATTNLASQIFRYYIYVKSFYKKMKRAAKTVEKI